MSKKPEAQKNQRIQVFTRCRPLNTNEKKALSPSVVQVITDRKEIRVEDKKMVNKTFAFDKVFDPNTDQITVYKAVVDPLIQEVLMGYNCTVFAYGQTGTGKTYTMEGERSNGSCSWEDDPGAGIIPRSMHHLFEELTKEENVEFSVRVSFLELYNEELFDLLRESPNEMSKLRLFEDSTKKGSVVIHGLEEIKVNTKDEVYAILEKGTARRQKAATMLNASSSRSHTVFSVTVHIKENTIDGEDLLKTGKLHLVDLAGSENVGRSGATLKTAREAGSINQSLLTLGRVITSLVEKAPHIPYRESKLTRLLQDSLGGHTKTSIIATISPAAMNMEETLSTLEYAQRAKCITIKPEVNQKMTKRALIKEYTEEIERLRRDVVAARDKTGFFVDQENFNAMQMEIATKAQTVKDLMDRMESMLAEKAKIEDLFAKTKEDLSATEAELNDTQRMYKRTTKELSKAEKKLFRAQKVIGEKTLQVELKKFIINTQEQTEQTLTKQAETLIGVADQTTQVISALHDKVDRTKHVEVSNVSKSATFQHDFQSKLSEFQNIVTQSGIEQTKSLSTLHGDIGLLLQLWNNQKLTNASFVDEILSANNNHMQALLSLVSNDSESRNECCSNMSKLANHQKEQQLALHQRFVENLNESRTKFAETHNNQEKLILELKNRLSSSIAFTVSTLTDVVNKHQAQTTVLSQMFDAYSKQQTTQLNDYELMLEKKAQQEKNLAEQIAELIAAMEQSSMNMRGDIAKDLIKTENDALNIKKEISCLKNKETQDVLFNSLCELKNNLNNGFEQLHAVSKNLNEHEFEICQNVSCYVELRQGNDQETFEKVNELVEVEMEQTSAMFDDYSVATEQYKEAQQSSVSVRKFENDENSKEFSKCCENSMNRTLASEAKMTEFTKSAEEKLKAGQAEVGKFVSKELKQVIPTGSTPQRRDYTYPQTLVSTSPHDRILERFHAKTEGVREAATNQPLNSSFEDELGAQEVLSMNLDEKLSNADEVFQNLPVKSEHLKDSAKDKENQVQTSKSRVPKKLASQNLNPARRPLTASNECLAEK